MPGDDRHLDAEGADLVDEVEVGVGVEEELGDRRVGAGLHLGGEVLQVALRIALLRVVLGIGRDLDVPVAPFLLADEGDQLAGVAELARGRGAARQVAAQGDQAADLLLPVGAEDLGDAFAGRADAGEMRRGGMAERGDVGDGGERLVAGGAAGAVGDAEELGPRGGELGHHRLQLLAADRRVRREELEAHRNGQLQCRRRHGVAPRWPARTAWRKNSRAPSPPGVALSNQSSTSRPCAAQALRRRFSAWP